MSMLAATRREQIRELLLESGAVTVSQLQNRFGVSPMTARRDLAELERRGLARRTHGGAVVPSVAAAEDSFTKRVAVATDAKVRLARAAFAMLSGHETVFLDSSSTAYFVAREIATGGLAVKVITNSGPVMQVLTACDDPNVELYAIGGMLRRLTGAYVGPSSVRAIREHFGDMAFLSVTGVTAGGILTDADELEAAVKLAMIQQARESVLLLDESKLGAHGRQAIAPLRTISLVLADGLGADDAARLRDAGPPVRLVARFKRP
jgi:DeoR/GlpR family transcriptional regulator of sugar metabolism